MDLQNYIGYPVEIVKKELESKNIKYRIIESSEIQKKFDTILVVKISQLNDIVEITTDKFLLNI
ncbi:MAG: hypothetical protein IKR12_02460 [Clostridia bacterium]|nr:hypothetical protein [Clostridia bacterium]